MPERLIATLAIVALTLSFEHSTFRPSTFRADAAAIVGAQLDGAELLHSDQRQVQQPPSAPQDQTRRFVGRALGDMEVTWKQIFAADGKTYRAPILVLYRVETRALCGGIAQSTMGPFYCPSDQKVYLDDSFFDEIATRYHGCEVGSKYCEFAHAYVIAHEIGHHVQNLLGILPKAERAQRAARSDAAANQIQVRVELQADCLAGLWANHLNRRLVSQGKPPPIEPDDIAVAMQTAAALGNDTLQQRTQGYVVPDSFTHGSAKQRQHWFDTGFRSGTIASCNTFAPAQL
jgi:uncharacterized protein